MVILDLGESLSFKLVSELFTWKPQQEHVMETDNELSICFSPKITSVGMWQFQARTTVWVSQVGGRDSSAWIINFSLPSTSVDS